VAIEALSVAGASGISVDFTLPDLVDTLAGDAFPLAPAAIEAVRRELDAKDAGGLVEAGGADYLPLLYAMGPVDQAIERLRAFDTGGALASRLAGIAEIAAGIEGKARLTLDPSERHGFEYQTWFGFTFYADGVAGALGRGGAYRILGRDEPAIGFSLYPDPLIDLLARAEPAQDRLFLPLGHDREAAARLRAIGWRTLAALGTGCDARALGCSHRLEGREPVAI
jgi:ATP phosphoribosyltransferase regulatory subunit